MKSREYYRRVNYHWMKKYGSRMVLEHFVLGGKPRIRIEAR